MIFMFPPIPQNCTVIETPLSHLVPVDDMGTVEEKPVYRCIPKLESNVIRLYALGNTSKVSYRPVCIAPGVDTHAIHDFNVSSGWTLPDERTEEERAAESIRTSISVLCALSGNWLRAIRGNFSSQLHYHQNTGKTVILRMVCKMLLSSLQNAGAESTRTGQLIAPISSIFLSQKCTKTVPFICTDLFLVCPAIVFLIRWNKSAARKGCLKNL